MKPVLSMMAISAESVRADVLVSRHLSVDLTNAETSAAVAERQRSLSIIMPGRIIGSSGRAIQRD
jgi:hypothetical protein